MPEEITKVSVYLHEGVGAYTERFVPRWKAANCAVAGPYWIDTTFANKDIGVRSICAIVEKYKGLSDFSVQDGRFILRVSL